MYFLFLIKQNMIYYYAQWVYQGAIGPKDTTKVNTWQHIVVTFDGTLVNLYKDGALANSQPANGKSVKPIAGKLMIGRYMADNLNHYDGMVDEVRIYNRALNATEVMQNFLAR